MQFKNVKLTWEPQILTIRLTHYITWMPPLCLYVWNRIRYLLCEFKLDLAKAEENEAAQSCLTLCNPMDCSLPGSSLHGILQARVLEWVAISFSRGSSRPSDRTWVSCIPGRCFNLWATREAQRQRNQRSNCQHPLDHWKSMRVLEKHLLLLYWLCQSLWLCESQQTVENSERDGNTRTHYLPPEKSVCRSRSKLELDMEQ